MLNLPQEMTILYNETGVGVKMIHYGRCSLQAKNSIRLIHLGLKYASE